MAHPYYGTPSGCPAHCTPSHATPPLPGVPETSPAPPARHTLPCTHLWRSEGGARCGRVSVKARRCDLHVPRDGSGEPARA